MKVPQFKLFGFKRPREVALPALGKLEREVMDEAWRRGQVSVREVYERLDGRVAYTTVMTTLDRLFKKGLLLRRREGRAFLYSAARSRDEMAASLTGGLLRGLLSGSTETARPFLSNLVDEVGNRDTELLDELERLVREKQAQTRRARE